MKKLLACLLFGAMAFSLVGCGSTCKESGCDEKVYEDGYCETHYAIHFASDLIGGLFG